MASDHGALVFAAPSLVTGALAFGLFYLAEKAKLVKLFPTKAERPDDSDSK